MVRGALIVLLCSFAAPVLAQPRVDVRVPECASTEVDVELLRELLAIELSGGADAIAVELGEALCEAGSGIAEVRIALPAANVERRDRFDLSGEPDPRARSRGLALAIAERARLLAVSTPLVITREPELPLALASPAPPPASATLDHDGEPDHEGETLAASSRPRALPPTLGLAARGRIAPALSTSAFGLRADVAASLDRILFLRCDLVVTWSRGSTPEGDSEEVVVGGAIAIGGAAHRDSALEVLLAARIEVGALIATVLAAGVSYTRETRSPWGTAGFELGVNWWLTPCFALVTDVSVGVSARTATAPRASNQQIDLLIELDVGLRVAL